MKSQTILNRSEHHNYKTFFFRSFWRYFIICIWVFIEYDFHESSKWTFPAFTLIEWTRTVIWYVILASGISAFTLSVQWRWDQRKKTKMSDKKEPEK